MEAERLDIEVVGGIEISRDDPGMLEMGREAVYAQVLAFRSLCQRFGSILHEFEKAEILSWQVGDGKSGASIGVRSNFSWV